MAHPFEIVAPYGYCETCGGDQAEDIHQEDRDMTVEVWALGNNEAIVRAFEIIRETPGVRIVRAIRLLERAQGSSDGRSLWSLTAEVERIER